MSPSSSGAAAERDSAVLRLVRATNVTMIGFDAILGSAAIAAPDATLRALGHARPSDDARVLFQRCGPIWLTFAVAHARAATRGTSADWTAVAWLRATEIATDVIWSRSPAVPATRSRIGLRLAGAFNLALAAGAARHARVAPGGSRA